MEQVFEADDLRGVLHTPEQANGDALALTHGAGSNAGAPLLVSLSRAFCEAGLLVLRYDLPFRVLGGSPTSPAAQARDREGVARAVQVLRQRAKGRVFAGGHSYGGRQTAMIAAERPGLADGLLLLSYPLHPPKRGDQMRTAHFPSLQTPALFVSGERDGFGTREEMESALKLIPSWTELMMISGAGHELMTAKNRAELPGRVVQAFLVAWVR
jgi:predicted alpha/beta-hydrolase family hydrolase